MKRSCRGLWLFLLMMLVGALASSSLAAQVVDYDIVYVRQPRHGDEINTLWPEVFHPARAEVGADLVLRHPDGSEEVLVDAGVGSVTDPVVSFDGKSVFYALFHDLRDSALNGQRQDLPHLGADIYRIDLATRQITQLTDGEFTPNTGAGNWDESNPLDPSSEYNRLGYGILNLGPMPVPGGRLAFTSNRNGFDPPRGFTAPTMQLFVMDEDGENLEAIAPMSISSALHPTILQDGRLMYSTHESQGLRDRRLWGVWAIQPDGRNWQPLISAFRARQAFHFMTQLSGGDLVVVDYYNLNNNGFGALYRMPTDIPNGTPRFGSPFNHLNPDIEQTVGGGFLYPFKMPFTPWGLHSITPFTHGGDEAAPVGADGSTRVGKFTHPSAAPGGDLLVVWTPGPANDLHRPVATPRYASGIYLIDGATPIWSSDELELVVDRAQYNEAWPRAVVPWSAIHGTDEPAELAWLPNDGTLHEELPAGTAYGLVGSSSLYKRESFPGFVPAWADNFDGLDAFNSGENNQSPNWFTQGADAGRYGDDEIWAVRLVAMEPNTHRSYGPNHGRHFASFANERLRILGEIPVRKSTAGGQPVLDSEGNPDTSFLAKVPADTPFTFQTLDREGRVLNMAQTWHQVRPGEVRVDCGGCHAHSQTPLAFETTAAGQPGFDVSDLVTQTPLVGSRGGEPSLDVLDQSVWDVEFYRDIRPLLTRSCIVCHTQTNPDPPGNLVLDDRAVEDGLPGDYRRLAADEQATNGYPPVIANRTWRQTNASRYIRKFQSRRSLFVWKIFGERLDGWSNEDHPTESAAGDATTLPPGTDPNDADLDFVGTRMPPPGSAVPALSRDERRLVARWIDLGAPIDTAFGTPNEAFGWLLDDLRPTVHISQPRPNRNNDPIESIRFGLADANSGLDLGALSVRASFPVRGRRAFAELADLAVAGAGGVWEISLDQPRSLGESHVLVEVRDNQGNITRVDRRFRVGETLFADDFESGDLGFWD